MLARASVFVTVSPVTASASSLVMVPLGLGKPYWIDDPDFNLDRHVQHIALPRPGGWRQLRQLAARTFSMPLDRTRPLWDMLFVEGLDEIPQVPPGSVAMINRVHHAAIDGVSGADMMSILFDITKEPRKVEPPEPRNVAPAPNELQVLRQVAKKIAGKPARRSSCWTSSSSVRRSKPSSRGTTPARVPLIGIENGPTLSQPNLSFLLAAE